MLKTGQFFHIWLFIFENHVLRSQIRKQISYLGYIALAQIWKIQYLSNLIIQIHTVFLHVKRGKMLIFINGKIGLRTGSGLKTNWKWTGSGNIIFRYSIYKLLWARLLIGMQLVKITSWLKRNKNIFSLCVAMIALSSHTPPRPSEISEKKMEQKRKPLLTSHAT